MSARELQSQFDKLSLDDAIVLASALHQVRVDSELHYGLATRDKDFEVVRAFLREQGFLLFRSFEAALGHVENRL